MTAIPPCPPADDCIPWCLDTSCCADWEELDEDVQNRSAKMAWDTIKLLTAGRLGSCAVTMRPCLSEPCTACASSWMSPHIQNGVWCNSFCGVGSCSCAPLCEITFPGPVAEVTEIMLDGYLIGTDMYRIDNYNKLIRQDGGCWPSCQNMTRPLGEVCTLGITYVPGVKPTAWALYAAGVLACEFSKMCSGNKNCKLPATVTSVARQGVNIVLTAGMWPGGVTGLREVDALIAKLNPKGLKVPPLVWSPDLPGIRHSYTTWEASVIA